MQGLWTASAGFQLDGELLIWDWNTSGCCWVKLSVLWCPWSSHLIILYNRLGLGVESCSTYNRRLRFIRLWVNSFLFYLFHPTGDILDYMCSRSCLPFWYLYWFILISRWLLCLNRKGCRIAEICCIILTWQRFLNQITNFAFVYSGYTWWNFSCLEWILQL